MVAILIALLLLIDAAHSSSWAGAGWERILESHNGYYAGLRGLACRADTNYLVLSIDSEPDGVVDRYECWQWYPYGMQPLSWPEQVSLSFRDLNHDSVDRVRPAYLTDYLLYRPRGAAWDSVDLTEGGQFTRPQCFCYDSTGALHFGVLDNESALRYSRRGGGLANRNETFVDGGFWGWADGNSTRIFAPAGGQVVLIGANLTGGPSITFRNAHVYTSPPDGPFSGLDVALDGRWKPRLLGAPGADWIYGVERGSNVSRRMLTIFGSGLHVEAVELPVDTLTNEYCFAWNALARAFELAVFVEGPEPRVAQVYQRAATGWVLQHELETPARVEGLHFWIDATGRGYLTVCDSLRMWYYGPPADAEPRPVVPESPALTLTVSPNPANSVISILLQSTARQPVHVQIVDLLGRTIWARTVTPWTGRAELQWEAADQASGLYLIAARSATTQTVQKVALLK